MPLFVYKKKNTTCIKGYTLLEILISLSVVGLIGIIPVLFVSNSARSVAMANAESIVQESFMKARSHALSGVDNSDHGVHIEEKRIVIFSGSTYSGTGLVLELPSGVHTDHISTDVVFSKLSGETGSAQTVTISNGYGDTASVYVGAYGFVQ